VRLVEARVCDRERVLVGRPYGSPPAEGKERRVHQFIHPPVDAARLD
jgi:hypothetical protein